MSPPRSGGYLVRFMSVMGFDSNYYERPMILMSWKGRYKEVRSWSTS